jgi:DNA binding protein with HTH domain
VSADPLYKLHVGDSNAEREAIDLMRIFDRWRADYGFALLLPVHCRKPPPGAKFSMHEFFGSSAYTRGAEVVVGLQMLRSGYSRLHFFKDRDGDLPLGEQWGLLFDRHEGFRRDPNDDKPKETAADKVRAILEAQPGMTIDQLAVEVEVSERTIRKALKQLGAQEHGSGPTTRQWSLLDEDEQ